MANSEKRKRNWLKISIVSDAVLVEAIGDFLVGVTGAAVEMGVDDHISARTINAFLEEDNSDIEKGGELFAQLEGHLRVLAEIFKVETPTIASEIIEEEDWSRSWKKHFHPFAIVPGLVIAPTWEDYQLRQDEKVITMDPGMAFGTGHHATTSMSLQLLKDEIDVDEKIKVLDVGTGTGILGMAAALFGAREVVGIDNDPEAVAAAINNVSLNGLKDKMGVSLIPLSSIEGEFTLLCANIVHDVLLDMVDDFYRLTATGGALIVSGILQGKQVESIVTSFSKKGYQLQKENYEKEWACLLFKKQ